MGAGLPRLRAEILVALQARDPILELCEALLNLRWRDVQLAETSAGHVVGQVQPAVLRSLLNRLFRGF